MTGLVCKIKRSWAFNRINTVCSFLIISAKETVQQSDANSMKLLQIAETEYEIATQTPLFNVLNELYSLFNITREDHKISLLMWYSLKVMNGPFYFNLDHKTLIRTSP